MKFKSALITQASGSIGGFTAGSNKGGLYLRARSIPTNPNSPAQQASRDSMKILVDAWTTILTAAQRDSWRTYAQNVPVVDVFGDSKLLTGQQMYIRSNSARLTAGALRVDAAPTTFNLGSFTDVSFTISAAIPNQVDVTFTNTDSWATAVGGHLILGISKGQNASRDFFKAPFRTMDRINGDPVAPTPPAILTSPFVYAEGQKVFVVARASQVDARLSTQQIPSTIVTA